MWPGPGETRPVSNSSAVRRGALSLRSEAEDLNLNLPVSGNFQASTIVSGNSTYLVLI